MLATGVVAQNEIDPAAVDTLRRMTDYLSTLQGFSVHTENTLEDLLDSGQRIDVDVAASVVVVRPNKLHAKRVGENVSQTFYYDGEALTLYSSTHGVYATEAAPGTLEQMFDVARESFGIVIPASDLIYRNAFAILMENVTAATVVGKPIIGGVTCTHLAFRRPDVDFQVWVADGDRPLPCKYVVTDTSAPEMVSTVTVTSDWKINPDVGADTFEFAPPAGIKEVEFLPRDETSAFGR